jgi:plastocyanin
MKALSACAVVALTTVLAASQVAPASEQGSATSSATKTVAISNFKFRPSTLEVGKGTKVVFSNTSNLAHTATDAGVFDTGRIKAGRAVSVRFGQKGTFRYHCKIHPEMRGKVVVG